MTIRELPAVPQGQRVESGATAFGNDWPGLFLRGDDCIGYSLNLEQVLGDYERLLETRANLYPANVMALMMCKGLLAALREPIGAVPTKPPPSQDSLSKEK